jgi:hypothetical protein
MNRERLQRLAASRAAALVERPLAGWGYRRYLRSGSTPTPAYVAFRKLYGSSPRGFQRLADRARREERAPNATPNGGLLAPHMTDALDALRRDGCYVVPTRLPDVACDDLERAARSADCALVGARPGAPHRARFDEHHPLAVRYDIDEHEIMASAAAQRLVADPSVFTLAARYLDTTPVQDLVAMWWSTPAEQASSAAAQLFHFDLDRFSFVKLFVYLTDVDDDTGPHVFVLGSHRAKPRSLRHDRRYSDAEVAAVFGSGRTITGPRGTVFLADTRGLHKGLELRHGHRLVFQLQYSTSLFGAPYESVVIADPDAALVEAAERRPRSYRRFSFTRSA